MRRIAIVEIPYRTPMTDGVTEVAVSYEERNPFVERVTILPDEVTIDVKTTNEA